LFSKAPTSQNQRTKAQNTQENEEEIVTERWVYNKIKGKGVESSTPNTLRASLTRGSSVGLKKKAFTPLLLLL
jgi:hypothetical protein